MILRENKILQTRMKRKKMHMMVMFVTMSAVNTSYVQHMNTRAQQQLYPSVRWESFCQSTNITMNILKIVLWVLNN